ncbi:hypothetical protein CLV43_101297 [Umezawaea tangerina]|uniref:Membrane protein YfhO n=2 Tax=Umezawaea tangerina TaxID=84725 RepID=A0A2T0TK41_9PSEU|nr:hypothetical protein CLV43_101297 [Umezawaea tangerina]
MTLTESRAVDLPDSAGPGDNATGEQGGRWIGFLTVLGVAAFVGIVAQLPLIRNRIFYYWDDSAAAFLPHWFKIGTELRSGNWPMLAPDAWMGGNFLSEVQLSLWNPVSLANYVLVSVLPDLAVAATLVKTEFLVLLAIGTYLLAREYGANRGAAAAVATALPFSGYTLFFDASAWVAGLIGFAWLPWVWWAARRVGTGRSNPLLLLVLGYLGMSVGSPYGALGIVVILLGVAVELLVRKNWPGLVRVVVTGAIVGMSTLVVYLPLLGSSAVTWRTDSKLDNNGFLVPALSDLFGLSAPTFQAQLESWQGTEAFTFPITYLAWFVAPLIPWLKWSELRTRARDYLGLFIFGTVYVLFTIGPSNMGMFRWPARLVEYVYLPVVVLFAVVLTKGLHKTAARNRAIISGVIVLAGFYLSWASQPHSFQYHVGAAVGVGILLTAFLFATRRAPKYAALVLVVGTAGVLGFQLIHYKGNNNVNPWNFPHDVSAMQDRFDHRYEGSTLLVADTGVLAKNTGGVSPEQSWRDGLFGAQWEVAGVQALNSYTGLGYTTFSDALCMNYYGGVCPGAFDRIWQATSSKVDVPLADALRLETVVVANGYLDGPTTAPDGWSEKERTKAVTVLHRDAPLAWAGGRLSYAAPGVEVQEDKATGAEGETSKYTGSGTVLYAALAWPGWTATVDGKSVEVKQGPAGLIQLDLPAAKDGGSTVVLDFQPPGLSLGWKVTLVAVVLGLGFAVLVFVRERRRRVVVE